MSDRMYSADRALPGVCDHVPYVLDAAAVDAVVAAVESSGLRVRSINGDIGDLNHPLDAEARAATGSRRVFLVLLASGVAISAWALFPKTVERGIYVPLPETSTPSAADVKSAREGVAGSPFNAYTLINAKLVSSKPTMYGVSSKATTYGMVPVRYSSPVDVSLVPLRSKLQALLMLLYSQSGDLDSAALEAKLQALLKLPDSVLAQVMEHPDLAGLNKMLDAVFLGTSDLSGVKTELDKIDVTSVPGPSEQIDVIKVNGKPAYIVDSPAVQNGPENAIGSPVSAPPPPGEPVTVTVVSQVEAPAALSASAVTVAPSSEPPPPPPAALSASAVTVAPSSEPPPPPPAPAALSAPAVTVAPSSEQLTPSPPPAPAPMPTSMPTPEITKSQEPTGTPQTSLDDLNSGTTDGGSTTNNGGSTTDGGSTTNNGGSTTDGGSTTNNGGSTTNNGGSTTDGGSTTNKGGSATNKGGSATNKGGHTGDTNDRAKKDVDKGEK